MVGLLSDFRDLRRFLPTAFTSRLPILDQAYDTAFDRYVPVSSGRVLGLHATPDSYWAVVRAPWLSAQVPVGTP